MKAKFIRLVLLLLTFLRPAHAQIRVLTGVAGGQNYGNTQIGITGGVEIPVKRIEFRVREEFYPYEKHTALGTGRANVSNGSGIFWLGKSVGVTAGILRSEYSTDIRKVSYYADGGVIFRKQFTEHTPTRVEFDYVRQVANKMVGGTESSYLQGFRVAVSTRIACSGPACYRFGWEFYGGRVLTQSNPLCDGSFPGPVTCPRGSSASGGFKIVFEIEFPRHKEREGDAF